MRLALLLPLLLIACVDTRLPVTNGRIITAEDFQVTVANRLFSTRDLSLAIRGNGTFSGNDGGQAFSGTWVFTSGQLCVTRTAPDARPTDCQIWTVDGNAFTVSRNSGRGPNTTYIYQFPLPPSFEERAARGG